MSEVIVELCQNHNGDKEILNKMIHAAKDAGVKFVKMQCIRSHELTHRKEFDEGIIYGGEARMIKRPYAPEFERLKSIDVPDDTYAWFVEKCKSLNLEPMITAFTKAQIPMLKEAGFKNLKIASYGCGSIPLLKMAKENFDFIVVSTGASYDSEIQAATQVLQGSNHALLHCVTIYPTPMQEVHLKRIDYLKNFAPIIGFSDHSLVERDGIKASLAAFAYGAEFIERHFTILEKDQSKDGPVSINSEQLKTLVEFGRLSLEERKTRLKEYVSDEEYKIMLGQQTRSLSHAELLNRAYYRGRFASKKEDGVVKYNWEE